MAGKGKAIQFIKMHSTGNDCIIIDTQKSKFSESPRLVRKILNRTTGIGADQLLLLSKSRKGADFKVRIFNADGSEAEMCGNGVRCIGRYIKDEQYTKKRDVDIETLAGVRQVRVSSKSVTVNLGEPRLKGKEIPVRLSGRIINRPIKVENKDFRVTCLSLGNPHCIIFQENLESFDIQKYGPLLENHQIFPNRSNIGFVNVLSPQQMQMRVWERGVGETGSCGTCAGAAIVAAVLNGFSDRKTKIDLPGGHLEVEWDKESNCVSLTGPVEKIFEGAYWL
ncbi:MAG: diaminopimelate epimerase [Deltaproteobacteria bacterium]|nr:diaminopimelate epimerase [Deltaproteobacteria bacterium]